jgi:S1-C subfamily serine protease
VADGIVIHLEAGEEKRTEFFLADRVSVGTDEACDLRLVPPADHAMANAPRGDVWLKLERYNGFYRVADFKDSLNITLNNRPLGFHAVLDDGDQIEIADADLQLSFFALSQEKSALTTAAATPQKNGRVAQFIETAALEAADTPERDDAKIFIRELTRELLREIGWATKLVVLTIVIAALSGVFYLGFSLYKEMERSRKISEQQGAIIGQLTDELRKSRDEIGNLSKTNKQIIDIVSLAPTLRNEYGNGVCLLVGTYDLVDRQTARQLRYPDPTIVPTPDPFEPQQPPQPAPQISEDGGDNFAQNARQAQQPPLTVEGGGSPVEFDFVGTGFHVGDGYIVTNRHVVQPWANDERVKVLAQLSNGRARLRRLVVYFPNLPTPLTLRVRDVSPREDLAIATIDPNAVSPDIPVLPLDANSDAAAIGKTVITMGYPNGPDRILAMVDESEARSIQSRYGSNLQTLINFLSQTKRIQPLTTQGTITDLQERRIVHDAKTAEGGSGAPLFGQSGRVIGVNFGVFTENTANNMAIPIKFVVPMLERAGWKSAEAKEKIEENKSDDKKLSANANAAPPQTTARNQ